MQKIVLAVHGGTGLAPETLGTEAEASLHAGLRRALLAGHAVLAQGGPAVDAVVAAVMEMEDDPNFNAGRGSSFDRDGRQTMDAGVMDGRSGSVGAVLGVCGPRNPVQAALAVLESGDGMDPFDPEGIAEFCRCNAIPLEDDLYFQTERRWRELQALLRRGRPGQAVARAERYGSVGAVALDGSGALAAATSASNATTFLTDDAPFPSAAEPVLGSAAWAGASRAVSATGDGDHFMRSRLVRDLSALMRDNRAILSEAAGQLVADIGARGGCGGLIGVDALGRVTMPFNARGMARGVLRGSDALRTAIFRETPRLLTASQAQAA